MIDDPLAGRTVLILGATGFIGRSIAESWRSRGAKVIGVICRNVSSAPPAPFEMRAVTPWGDGLAALIDALRPEIIFHAAGSASVPGSISDPANDFAAGPGLFQVLLEGIRRSRVRPRVLFPSSAAVYGNPEHLPVSEAAPLRPISPYGHHKAASELLAREYATCFDVPVTVLRIFSLFGIRQKRLLVWELFRQFMDSDRIVVQGTGHEVRDFLHIDALGALAAVLTHEVQEPFAIINVATGRGTSVAELAEAMRRVLGSKKNISYANRSQLGNPDRWIADISVLARVPDAEQVIADHHLEDRLAATFEGWRAGHSVRANTG